MAYPVPLSGVKTMPTARSTQAVGRSEKPLQTTPSTGRTPSPRTLCALSVPAGTRVVSELSSTDLSFLLRVRFPTFISKTPSRIRPDGRRQSSELPMEVSGRGMGIKIRGAYKKKCYLPALPSLRPPSLQVRFLPSSTTEQRTEARTSTLWPLPTSSPTVPSLHPTLQAAWRF